MTTTNLTPPLFIKVPVPTQESQRSCAVKSALKDASI